jgi:hypothetical protein
LNSVYGTGCGPESRSWTVSTPNRIKYPTSHTATVCQRGLGFGGGPPLGSPSVRHGPDDGDLGDPGAGGSGSGG